jgi:hypothetical protein
MAICKNCTKWSLGSMDTTSTTQPFIFALGPTGDSISSDSTSQNIDQHSLYNGFSLDMTQASFSGSGSPDLNSGSGAASSNSGSSSSSGATTSGGGDTLYRRVHGIFMAIAFVILFPLGVLVLRLGHSVIGHGIVQATAYCFVIVGLGTGIYLSSQFSYVSSAHSRHAKPNQDCFRLLTQRNQTDNWVQYCPPNYWSRSLRTPCCSSPRRPHPPPSIPPWPQDHYRKSPHGPRYRLIDPGHCQRTSRSQPRRRQ